MYANRMQIDVWDRERHRGILYLGEHIGTGEVVVHSYQVGDKHFPCPEPKHANMNEFKSYIANHFPKDGWQLRTIWEKPMP